MEGLEVSEVGLSELERTKRIDSEFYRKENLKILAFIEKKEGRSLTDFVHISDGNHMSISDEFIDVGIPYYRGQDVHSFFIENSNPVCIDENIYNKPVLQRSHLKYGDILLSIVGTIGKLSLVSTHNKATCSCKLAILRPKSNVSSELLAMFLNCKYGQNQIQKFVRGAVQMGLILEDMDQLYIPNFSKSFDKQISQKIQSAKELIEQSQKLYHQAEEMLLQEIGLSDFGSSIKNVNIKSFGKSFLETGRLDAEYYQPKYEEIMNKAMKGNYASLDDLVKIKKSIEPGSDFYSDTGIPFLRVADYNQFEITPPEIHLSEKFCKENDKLIKSLYPRKKTILFSKDGSVGTAYMVREDIQAVTCGALLHLTVKDKKKVLPEYLTLVLNSQIVRKQAERDAGGSIILHWRIEEIKQVVIPIIDYKLQQKIALLIEKSFSFRKESGQLLELAKKAVEKSIEEGEGKAIRMIGGV
ncbi:hypothetical protein FACS1894110_07000 [Spirochaetia bacterium]|nr:hypothetical protein FACS1894110_07000 [Spirochaetia bacterium]